MGISIKTRKTFVATDNTEFFEEGAAKDHEDGLEVMRIFMKHGFRNNGELKNLCVDMVKTFDEFSDILTKVRSRKSRQKGVKVETR